MGSLGRVCRHSVCVKGIISESIEGKLKVDTSLRVTTKEPTFFLVSCFFF